MEEWTTTKTSTGYPAEEPGWLACLEDAMRLVNRDVAATGMRRTCQLRVHDVGLNWSTNAYVETWDGYTGIADGIYPAYGADPVSALVAVAEGAQDALMHAHFAAWPVCTVHRLGAHASYHAEAAVWWCSGDGGHAVTAIGQWQSANQAAPASHAHKYALVPAAAWKPGTAAVVETGGVRTAKAIPVPCPNLRFRHLFP